MESCKDESPLLVSDADSNATSSPYDQGLVPANSIPWKVPRWILVLGASVAIVLVVTMVVVVARLTLPDTRASMDYPELRAVSGCGIQYEQCGGVGFAGSQCCVGACQCSGGDQYYKQCVPPTGTQTCDKHAALAPALVSVAKVTHCSGVGEDCTESKCCNSPDLQCYQKNPTHAICKSSCHDDGDWSCKQWETSHLPKIFRAGTGQCAWGGHECQNSNCCKIPGMKCFEKNPGFATCKKICVPGPDPREPDKSPWSCVERKARPLTYLLPAMQSANNPSTQKLSLFCFTFVMPLTYEVYLMDSLKKKSLGIFSCDAFAVFQAGAPPKGAKKKDMKFMPPKSIAEIWDEVKRDGRYAGHDWTVKAHPDSVFISERLHQHLTKLHAPKNNRLYLKKQIFKSDEDYLNVGALQVLSNQAMVVFLNNKGDCENELFDYGEDFFLTTCLDSLNIGHIVDVTLLLDQYASGSDWDANDDTRCKDSRWVAFHPYKELEAWMACHNSSQGKETT